MSAQPDYYPAISSGGSSSAFKYDPQVRLLEAKMKDWETCPTTDLPTKKKIVDQLASQLQGVEAALTRQTPPQNSKVRPGQLDILV